MILFNIYLKKGTSTVPLPSKNQQNLARIIIAIRISESSQDLINTFKCSFFRIKFGAGNSSCVLLQYKSEKARTSLFLASNEYPA